MGSVPYSWGRTPGRLPVGLLPLCLWSNRITHSWITLFERCHAAADADALPCHIRSIRSLPCLEGGDRGGYNMGGGRGRRRAVHVLLSFLVFVLMAEFVVVSRFCSHGRIVRCADDDVDVFRSGLV